MSDVLCGVAAVFGYVLIGMVMVRVMMILDPGSECIAPLIGALWPFVAIGIVGFYLGRALWRGVDYPFTAISRYRTRRAEALSEVTRWLEGE